MTLCFEISKFESIQFPILAHQRIPNIAFFLLTPEFELNVYTKYNF